MNIYIDTNIYLDYFREGSDNLTPLRELEELLVKKGKKKLTLLIPDQTEQEYFNNRSQIVEVTRKALIAQNKPLQLPALMDRSRKESKEALKKSKSLQKEIKEFIKKFDDEVENEKTDADKIIKKLFSRAKLIPENKKILDRAYIRYLKGAPPRKNNHSYGDAIIWETLLEIATKNDLIIITRDGDFAEERRGEKIFKPFLEKEWGKHSSKKIRFYPSLAEFVKFYNKKSTIKQKVVEQEKEKPLYNHHHPEVFISSGAKYQPITLKPDISYRIPLWGEVKENIIHCPYCGHNVDNEIKDSLNEPFLFKSTLAQEHSVSSFANIKEYQDYFCTNCERKFTLSK